MLLARQIPQARQIKSSRTKQPIYFWPHGSPITYVVESMNKDKEKPAWATSLKREAQKISVKESHETLTAQRHCQVGWDSQRKEALSGVEEFSTK